MRPEELTWQDIKAIIAIEGDIYIEGGNDPQKVIETYDTEEKFYSEILRRFNELKEKRNEGQRIRET